MQSDSGKSGRRPVASRAGRVTDVGELPDELVLLAEQLSDDAAHIAERNPAASRSKAIMQREAVQTYEQESARGGRRSRYGWPDAQVAAAVLLIAVGSWAAGVLTSQWWTVRGAVIDSRVAYSQTVDPTDGQSLAGQAPLVISAAFIRSLSPTERSTIADIVDDDVAEISFALR